MKSKQTLGTALVLAATMTATMFAADQKKSDTTAAATADAKAPRLTLVEPLKDFGTVPKGQKIDWTFSVKNTGDKDLEIFSANPGCGCTVAEFDKIIKPGQVGKVVAHVDTTAFAGPISKQVTLQTNDPDTPSSQLTIHAVVKPYVDASPAGFVRYTMLQGDAKTQTITLYSEEETPFEITGVEVPGDWVKVTYSKITDAARRVQAGRDGQNQFAVDVTVGGPTAPIGPLAQKITLLTNSKFQPTYPISVTGVIRPTYSVNPSVLNFGEVAPGEASAARTVVLFSNDKEAPTSFKVEKVESSTPGAFDAIVKPTERPGEYEVEVRLAKGAKAGALDGNLKIFTSDKINPVYSLPVKATVKAGA